MPLDDPEKCGGLVGNIVTLKKIGVCTIKEDWGNTDLGGQLISLLQQTTLL